jgi:hypothetical protein
MQTLPAEAVRARVEAMAIEGLLEELPDGAEPRYAVTDWGRLAVAPLAAAARMELRYPPGGTAPIAVADVEAAFRLALPLLRLPAEAAGSCALAVGLEPEVAAQPVGVTVHVEEGRLASLEPGIDPEAGALASASAGDWLDTLVERDVDRVQRPGNRRLARILVEELHETLFGGPRRAMFGGPAG